MQTDIPGGPTVVATTTLVGVALQSGLRDIIENTCTRTDHYTSRPIVRYTMLSWSRDDLETQNPSRVLSPLVSSIQRIDMPEYLLCFRSGRRIYRASRTDFHRTIYLRNPWNSIYGWRMSADRSGPIVFGGSAKN